MYTCECEYIYIYIYIILLVLHTHSKNKYNTNCLKFSIYRSYSLQKNTVSNVLLNMNTHEILICGLRLTAVCSVYEDHLHKEIYSAVCLTLHD